MKKHQIKTIGIGLIALSVLAILRIWDPYPIEVLRLKGLDFYQRQQEKKISENITVVEIDEDITLPRPLPVLL